MDVPDFSVYKHYRKKSSSEGFDPEGDEEENNDEDNVDAKYDLTYRQLCDWLRTDAFSGMRATDKEPLEGISILQFSKNPILPRAILLRHSELMSMVANKCFFWIDICTENWKKARYKLNPFYVVSFRVGGSKCSCDFRDVNHEKITWVHCRGYCSYILRCDEVSLFLQSSLFRQYKENYKGDCRIDYFTTNPCVALFLDDDFLSCFLGSMMGLSIIVHQNMKVAKNDYAHHLFDYIRRNKMIRSHINDSGETGS